MTDKERLYHQVNVYGIPIAVLAGIVFAIFYNSTSTSSISPFAGVIGLFSMILGIAGVIWVIVSGLINENVRRMVIKGIKGVVKWFAGLVTAIGCAVWFLAPAAMVGSFFLILIVFGLLAFLWEVGLVVLAIYLF